MVVVRSCDCAHAAVFLFVLVSKRGAKYAKYVYLAVVIRASCFFYPKISTLRP